MSNYNSRITEKNKKQYDKFYSTVDVSRIIKNIKNFDNFFNQITKTDISWVGFFKNNFEKEVKNKKVLELGCGDGVNSSILATLGADVYANDISDISGNIIEILNNELPFKNKIKYLKGDFLKSHLNSNYFDFVVGKNFVHHLTNNQEIAFTKKIVDILKPDGRVRYFEPAVNSKIFDEIRWHIPVPGRPSKFQKNKFKLWKENDPHPERDNSSKSYMKIGQKYFRECKITPIGTIERFYRLLPNNKFNWEFRRLSYRIENFIPISINMKLARAQIIDYRFPLKK